MIEIGPAALEFIQGPTEAMLAGLADQLAAIAGGIRT